MICEPCTTGDHCGKPGEINTKCFCQHRPRRPRPQEAVSGPVTAPVVPTPTPAGDDAPGGLLAVLKDVPTVVLLSAWQQFHRRRAFAAARHVRSVLDDRLSRNGRGASA